MMSAVDRTNKGQSATRNERGMSLAELLVVLALMSIVGLIFSQLYIGTIRTTMFLESHNDLASFGQRAVNTIKLEVMQSRRIFKNDPTGNSYLGALALPSSWPMLPNSRLPRVDANGEFRPDLPTEQRTGNSFLSVRELEAITTTVDHDADASTADVDYLANVYRFQLWYLTSRSDKPIKPYDYALDLIEFKSIRYADYVQLSGLSETFRTEVAKVLYAENVRFAWDPTQDADSAFYQIDSAGTMTALADHKIPADEVRNLMPQLLGGRISGAMDYSIGITGSPELETKDPVSILAQKNPPFPGGFEVQVIGTTGARQAMLRLMLVAEYHDRLTSRANTVIVTFAEY